MLRNLVLSLLLATSALIGPYALADEPSLHQVYQAAEAGKFKEAQTMMHDVLQAHPNSGKAHFVEAELLAKQGQLRQAEVELATAERLAPGLPFAKPDAVRSLQAELGVSRNNVSTGAHPIQSVQPAQGSSFPWSFLLIGVGLIAFIAWAARFMTAASRSSNSMNASGSPAGTPMQPYGAGGMGSTGAMGMPGQGLGSTVMSGLATGAAVGVGMAAGEALMHHFMDGRGNNVSQFPGYSPSALQDSTNDEMGGTDFGVSDNSSWDDSAGGGSDWN